MSARSTIELVITGSTRGLNAAAAEARAMAERIAAAEDRVAEARRRSAEAEARVADVENRLAGARAQHTAALSQIGVAETHLAEVRDRNQGTTTRLQQAEDRLEALRRGGASAQTIARAEADIARVRTEADRQAAALQRAEANLERARANAAGRAGQVAALEERLAQARGRAFRASEDLARAETDLGLLRRRGNDDINRQRDGIGGIVDAFSRLIGAFTGADGASTSLLSKLAALNSVFTSIGGPIIQTVVGVLQIIAVMGALGEIVGVVGGLIGQVLAGAPAILVALAAAAGTAALGMDGIKKAAEVLKPAFDQLKKDVSEVFVQALTPAFRQLAAVIPQLTSGFQDVAGSIAIIAQDVLQFVTSARGIEVINRILAGTTSLLQALAPGFATFVQGLLTAGAVGTEAMQRLGGALGAVFDQLGAVFITLSHGVITQALTGLASVIQGLGNVVAVVVEILIRMGAALGDTVGSSLTELGNILRTTIPFFEDLARVAGVLLVEAFKQLGPRIEELFGGALPAANKIMDQFASFVTGTVLPAIAGFIHFLATDGLSGIGAFVQGAAAGFLEFASSVVSAISQTVRAVAGFIVTLAQLSSGEQQVQLLQAAQALGVVADQLDHVKGVIDTTHDKVVSFTVNVPSDKNVGEVGVLGVADAMTRVNDKTVTTTANVPSGPNLGLEGNQVLQGAIGAVLSKTTVTTSSVPGGPTLGTQGNLALTDAITGVNSKVVTTTGNVPGGPTLGTQGNQLLTEAIAHVLGKTVEVVANVVGLGAVTDLIGAIGRVVGKTVNIVANVIGAGASLLGFASGGQAPGGIPILVGERGPELIMLPRGGGFVNDANQTRQILNASRPTASTFTSTQSAPAAADQPITVNVMLSQEQIAGIAQVEIVRANRSTKRTVLAGSGVTF